MDTEGTYDSRGTRSGASGAAPGRPATARTAAHAGPRTGRAAPPLGDWLRIPRPLAEPGVWRSGHTARPAEDAGAHARPAAARRSGDLAPVRCMLVWSLWRNGYIPYWRVPLKLFTPDAWWGPFDHQPLTHGAVRALDIYRLLIIGAIVYGFGRLGNWPAAFERAVAGRGPAARAAAAAAGALLVWILVWTGTVPGMELTFSFVAGPWMGTDRTLTTVVTYTLYALITLVIVWPFARLGRWSRLRRRNADGPPAEPHGAPERAWNRGPGTARRRPRREGPRGWRGRSGRVARTARRRAGRGRRPARRGGPVGPDERRRLRPYPTRLDLRAGRQHPAGRLHRHRAAQRRRRLHPPLRRARSARSAPPGTICSSARSGSARSPTTSATRTPTAARASPSTPALLGTSLLAVGPPGCGQDRAARPARRRVAVPPGARRAGRGRRGRRRRHPSSEPTTRSTSWSSSATPPPSTTSTCTAAPPTPTRPRPSSPRRWSATSPTARRRQPARRHRPRPAARPLPRRPRPLPRRARAAGAAGRRPGRARAPCARRWTRPGSAGRMHRELDARARQSGAPGDVGPAARRPGRAARPARVRRILRRHRRQARPFSLRALDHPLRVRIDLPERGHAEASRMLARLVLAQFTASAVARADRSLFACLVLDDATAHASPPTPCAASSGCAPPTPGPCSRCAPSTTSRRRCARALLGAVGCRMAFSGVTTWDGERFAEAWGTEWVETRDVTDRHDHRGRADDPGHPRLAQAGHRQGGDHASGDRARRSSASAGRPPSWPIACPPGTRCCR